MPTRNGMKNAKKIGLKMLNWTFAIDFVYIFTKKIIIQFILIILCFSRVFRLKKGCIIRKNSNQRFIG